MKKFFPLLILAILFSPFSFSQINLQKGLIAWYPFNGNTNDESGNNNHPAFADVTFTQGKSGKKKSACYFNGKSNYIRIRNNQAFSPSELSLVAIIKPNGFYNGICYNNSVIDKGTSDYVPGCYSLRFTAGEYTNGDCYQQDTKHQNFVGMTSNNGGITSKSIYAEPDKWYCIVYTFSRRESRLYVNGKMVSSFKPPGGIGRNNDDIFLGKKDNVQYPYWFHGVMDEIRFYNRILNTEEVLALCNNQPVPPCSGSAKPSARFEYDIPGCTTVSFKLTGTAADKIKSVKWHFGDGQSAGNKSVQHTYSGYGTFKAKAIVTDKSGCSDTVTREIKLAPLKTGFVFTEKSRPGEIEFRAKNNNAACSWNFGNGTSAENESAATVTYNETGNYRVQLFARNHLGCTDTVSKEISVVLPQIPEQIITPPEPVTAPDIIPAIIPDEREKDIQEVITVTGDSVSILLYDNGIIDGDSITLICNNQVVASHLLLSVKPVVLKLRIDRQRNTNELVMYAENLGSIPPNTALMIINDGEKSHRVSISSTRKTSGAVSFIFRDKQPGASQ